MSRSIDDLLRRTYGQVDGPPGAIVSPHQVIRASAGAGKTYQLTTRYLRLLRAGEMPEHILATTFTRKAAGEILQRVLGWLAQASRDDGPREHLREALGGFSLSRDDCIAMLRRLVVSLHRLNIGTIDSFFNKAASAMRYELELPADPRLTDEGSPVARQLRRDAIQALLGDAVDSDDDLRTIIEMLRRLLHDQAQRSVTDAIDAIVADLHGLYRQHPDPALWHTLQPPGLLTQELLGVAIEGVVAMGDAMPKTGKGTPNKLFADRWKEIVQQAIAGDWRGLLGNGLIDKVRKGETTYSRTAIDPAWHEALRPLIVHAESYAVEQLAGQTESTYQLLERFDRHYEALRRDSRLLLFGDLTHLLANVLPNATSDEALLETLYFRLDARVTHLLLDEFQDTSVEQWKVLAPFADEVTAVSDGSRSFFCVGDVKQAIYGWRGGCAELFDQVEALPGLGEGATLNLSVSRRSSQIVLDAVNQVFCGLSNNDALGSSDAVVQAACAWQAGYKTHEAHGDLPGYVSLITTAPVNNDESDDDEGAGVNAHARFVAQHIKELTEREPGRSVGVLVRRRKSATAILFELRRMGVRVSEEGGNPIDNVPAVSAVLAALQLADHPGDSAARFHVTNSPLGEVVGLTDGRADAAVRVAAEIRRALMDHGYASLLADWARALAGQCDARSLRRLTQLVELAEVFSAEMPVGNVMRASDFIEHARAARIEEPVPAPVRVMTVHASKGLEFDTVVLPDLAGRLNHSDHNELILLDREGPTHPPRAILRRPRKEVLSVLPELESAIDQRAAEKRREDLCLLYVAMTRAKYSLHLMVPPLKQTKSGVSSAGLSDLSYAAILRQALCVNAEDYNEGFDGGEVLYEHGRADWHSQVRVEAAAPPRADAPPIDIHLSSGDVGTRSWAQATPSSLHDQGAVTAADLLGMSDGGGMAHGSVMHAMFELIGFVGEDSLPDEAQLNKTVKTEQPDAGDEDSVRYRRVLHEAISHESIAAALSRDGASILWRERPFAVRVAQGEHAGRLIRGTFDRVAIWQDESGRPIRARLMDFKTDRLGSGGAEPLVRRYQSQIHVYRLALCAMLGLGEQAIEAQLLFVGDGVCVQVPGGV